MAEKMVEKKIPSALPLYIAAGVFLAGSCIFSVYRLSDLLIVSALALGAYVVAQKRIPPRVILVPAPAEPFATGEAALDEALLQAQRDLEALRELNVRIPDAALSAQIDRMEKAGASILREVRAHPEKGRNIRKFVTYYLPTAVKILKA